MIITRAIIYPVWTGIFSFGSLIARFGNLKLQNEGVGYTFTISIIQLSNEKQKSCRLTKTELSKSTKKPPKKTNNRKG